MDPFTITTGILGLLGTAATVIKFLDTVKSTVRDAPKTVAWALAEVNDVRSAVARLHDLFGHIDSIPKDARALVTVQDAAVTVSELVTSFDDLVDVLKPLGVTDPSLMRTWDKVKWARRQDDVAKVIMRIQIRKSSLTLMLNIFQCESNVVAMESRSALENGINTIIEGNIGMQKRLERMERHFEAKMERLLEAYLDNAPTRKMLGYDGTQSDAISVRSASGMTRQAEWALLLPQPQIPATATASSVIEGLGFTQDGGRIPSIRLRFEETLAESTVYRRVQQPFDAFSVLSSDDRSVTRTIMTTYSLADDASVLSRYPIIDRSDLRHPEFYAAVEPTRESRFLSALVTRRRRSSDKHGSPQMSVPQKKVRTPPNCGEDVMGHWSFSTRRIWRPTEFRFETLFEVPVIFVCPPSNTEGPIKNQPIHFVSGTPGSLSETRALIPREEEAQRQSMQESPAYADGDDRASWLTLLSQLQTMEKESQEWQLKHYCINPMSAITPVRFNNHTLAVAIQAKRRSWDAMPAGIKKPYASTTFSHLLEIAAMMGIFWKEFDRQKDRYQAEGNGYFLTGTYHPGLGVIFTLQIYSRSKFQENRVIPASGVKELCCGFVSTMFHEDNGERTRSKSPIKDLSYLQLSSARDVADTMVSLGCNTDTANYFRSDHTEYSHLFPVPFELLGMLSKTVRIRNSSFRMLPNPTPYGWDRNSFNLPRLVREYYKNILDPDLGLAPVPQVLQLSKDVDILVWALERDKTSRTPGYSLQLLNTLHDILDRCDRFLKDSDRDLVRIVVREHFQTVLKLINDEAQITDENNESVVEQRAEHFGELTAASPEEREAVFMGLYFDKVRRPVSECVALSYYRQKPPLSNRQKPSLFTPRMYRSRLSENVDDSEVKTPVSTPLAVSQTPPSGPGSPSLSQLEDRESNRSVPTLDGQTPDSDLRRTEWNLSLDNTSVESCASSIWCTLVLRMMCWLLLHDFDKNDVQIPKSELLGSQLPVYIA